MPAVSKKQQRFFGIVRAAQKGTLKGKKTLEVQRAAASMKKKDVKKFASTKHKGLPEKKVTKESFNEDYVKELEDGLVKLDYPTYDEVDELMKKIAKDNGIDTTVLHMAFKTKHLMVPDDWAKKKMFEPVMIPKTPKDMECEENLLEYDGNYHMNKIAKEKGLDLTDPRQRRRANSLARKNAAKGNINNPMGRKKKKKKLLSASYEPIVVSEKRKIGAAEKRLHQREMGDRSNDMIVARRGEADKQNKLIDKYQRKQNEKNSRKNIIKGIKGGEVIQEGSLHKWFSGSKSKDGKGGWVNVVTGGTCASDKPGEGTPKCVSSSKRASMSKSERLSAARRKKAADPGQQSKSGAAKPTYVSTDSPRKKVKKEEFEPVITEKCWKGYEKKGMKTMFGKRYPNCVKKKRTRKEEYEPINELSQDTLNQAARQAMSKREAARGTPEYGKRQKQVEKFTNAASKKRKEIISKKDKLQKSFDKPDAKRTPTMEGVKRDEYGDPIGGPKISKKEKEKNLRRNTPDEQHTTTTSEGFVWECWKTHKKVGMKMKGGKLVNDCRPKNESYEIDEAKNAAQQAAIAISKKNRLQDLKVAKKRKLRKESLDEKLVHGKFGNYIKNQKVEKTKDKPMKKPPYEVLAASYEPIVEISMDKASDAFKKANRSYQYADSNEKRQKFYKQGKKFANYAAKKYKKLVSDRSNLDKTFNKPSAVRKEEVEQIDEFKKSPAWQRKAGKSESGGLNAKGVASYRAANPGSKLKTAVTTKPSKLKKGSKSAKRRLSFCRRMKGMKKKLTSAKTARDPDSRINKSLRKWNCSYEPEGNFISEDYVKGGVRNNPSTTSTKKVSGMIKALQRKQSVLKQPMKAMDAGARGRRLLQRREHERYVSPIIPDHLKDEYTPVIEEGKSAKKCKDGQYYCFNDKKCKPIPSGYRIGYGGMLRPENKEDDSNGKKGGSNGNGNGNGGNGNGHGGNGNGGNGGGNGGGE